MIGNGVKVLVVDDGRDNRDFIVDYVLRPHGFEPIVARDGVEGMEIVRKRQPDIILLDLQMPRMNGLQVLDALNSEGWDIPVILMTFHGSEDVAVEVYRKGVRDYVKKPYTIEEMLEAMDRCLGEVRLRKEKDALTERLLHANATLNRRIRELNALYQIGKSVTALVGMEQLMVRIVDAATQVIGAEQGSLMLLEHDTLVRRAVKLRADLRARPDAEIVEDPITWRAVKSGQPVILKPEELYQYRQQDPSLPAAVVIVPVQIGGRTLGVLSVENVQMDSRPFTQQDGAMLSALADYAAVAIENTRIYNALEDATAREKDMIRSAFERYVAPIVVDRVLHNPTAMQLGGRRQEISVLIADVRAFTTYSEQASPEEVVKTLNEYFSLATDVIFSREGTIDKFVGDAVVAFFNAPEDQPDHPYRAVEAALTLQRAVAERNERVEGDGLKLTFGVGVHMGQVVVGNIGTTRAMNYTAIGDPVNVANRLQERALAGEVLITAEVYERLGHLAQVESVGDMTIKGRQQPIRVYRLLGLS